MCVICTAGAGAMPSSLQLAQMSDANPDGAGVAWFDGRKLHRYRNPDNDQTLGFIIRNRAALAGMPVLMHFRLATNGAVCEQNTHPFAWKRGDRHGYMAHNGISRRYSHGPHQCDSRNAIAAWEQGADLSQGTEGCFASIDQTGRLDWLTPGTPIPGEQGTITVSNTVWMAAGLDYGYGYDYQPYPYWGEDEDDIR